MTFESQLKDFIHQLNTSPASIKFSNVMEFIGEHYDYQATDFDNGIKPNRLSNAAGTNEGSCKIFAFAQLNDLNEKQTLACFAEYYRDDVLKHPEGTDHQNIRNFMLSGWAGIQFSGTALALK